MEIDPNHSHNQAIDIVTRFNDTLNARDVEGMLRLMTADCIFENTCPAAGRRTLRRAGCQPPILGRFLLRLAAGAHRN